MRSLLARLRLRVPPNEVALLRGYTTVDERASFCRDGQRSGRKHSTDMISQPSDFIILAQRDLISLRTREALAAKKASGLRLGKPKGKVQSSKFDTQRERIEE
jgi:hypothetical protein